MVARELTKLHEEVYRGTLAEAVSRFASPGARDAALAGRASGAPRGEFTIVLGPRSVAELDGGRTLGSGGAMAAVEAR